MESFYGGRQGISFIVVHHFDSIGPSSSAAESYKLGYFKADNKNNFKYPLEEKNHTNFADATVWRAHLKNGQKITVNGQEIIFPVEKLDSMVDCFKQGGKTVDIVNYGEYVIIDSPNKNDPDNGKIFRRGLNYDYDPVKNPFAGAEYIGQVVGPDGKTPEVFVKTVADIEVMNPHTSNQTTKYDLENGGLIEGYQETGSAKMSWEYFEPSLNKQIPRSIVFNDEIHYAFANVLDEYGNITGCCIGFTFPILKPYFYANPISPYDIMNAPGEYDPFYNLVEQRDGKNHPYFQAWKISVPKGIKGDSVVEIEIVDTVAKKDTVYYTDETCTEKVGALTEDCNLILDTGYYKVSNKYNPEAEDEGYYAISLNDTYYYVLGSDTIKSKMRLKVSNYDRLEEGEITFYDLIYNTLDKIVVNNDGTVNTYYTYGEMTQNIIDVVYAASINESNGDINFYYSNNDKVFVTTEGKVLLNDGAIPDIVQEKVLPIIDKVKINSEDENGNVGEGNQLLSIRYRNKIGDENDGWVDVESDPLNYILEVTITKDLNDSSYTEPGHLLVLYSDPHRRANITNKGTYPSKYRTSDQIETDMEEFGYVRSDWEDFGSVRGSSGLQIGGSVSSESELIGKTPEDFGGKDMVAVDGEIYFYDPVTQTWVNLGSLGTATINFDNAISVGKDKPDVNNFVEGGIWFVEETIKYVPTNA